MAPLAETLSYDYGMDGTMLMKKVMIVIMDGVMQKILKMIMDGMMMMKKMMIMISMNVWLTG